MLLNCDIREAVHLATVNWEAKLSAQDRFSQTPFNDLLILLTRAARDPAHHPAIMPCAEALLWASGNDFTWVGQSLAERAAATCVSAAPHPCRVSRSSDPTATAT